MVKEKRELLIEIGVLAGLAYFLFFVSVAINPVIGSIYTLPVLLAIVLIMGDYFFGERTIKFINPNVSWFKAFAWGIGGYVLLILSTQLASGLAKVIPLTEILSLLGATSPIFSQSPFLNFLIFAGAVAIIETMAFGVVALDVFGSIFKVQLNKQNLFNPKLILIMISLSVAFLLYHVQAKGIGFESEAILILVFFMMFISLVTMVWLQDYRASIILHILANSIAMSSIFNINPITIILPLVGIG